MSVALFAVETSSGGTVSRKIGLPSSLPIAKSKPIATNIAAQETRTTRARRKLGIDSVVHKLMSNVPMTKRKAPASGYKPMAISASSFTTNKQTNQLSKIFNFGRFRSRSFVSGMTSAPTKTPAIS